jgi:hypothetical protein
MHYRFLQHLLALPLLPLDMTPMLILPAIDDTE